MTASARVQEVFKTEQTHSERLRIGFKRLFTMRCQKEGPAEAGRSRLIDNFNDSVRARIDQDRTVVHDGVAILRDTVLSRHFIIGHAAGR